MVDWDAELKLFNSLPKQKAKNLLGKAEGKQMALRSCWYCNPAHKHLTRLPAFRCFGCWNTYVFGYPVEVLIQRQKDLKVTTESITDFITAVKEETGE